MIHKLVRRGFEGPRRLLEEILKDAQKRGEIAPEVDAASIARFLIAAFHGLVLQLEWEPSLRPETFVGPLTSFVESLLVTSQPK